MSSRENISSGSKWEDALGYSRAVKVGDHVFVSGTTATGSNGEVVGANDIYLQAKFILRKIEKVLNQAGAEMKDVVRTRIFVTDISKWESGGKAHAEFFKNIRPAATMVEVKAFILPELLIEIEVDALIAAG